MKRLLSLVLSAALLSALALPAAAEETADAQQAASAQPAASARLAKVTQAVKTTLDLDTDAYETFRGGVDQELVSVWDLNWESEERSLSVQALEDGTVLSLYRWDYAPATNAYWGNRLPTFPENAGAETYAAARDFLDRVLRKGETAELKQMEESLSLGDSGGSWFGQITLNGLPSPFNWSIRVENGVVEYFSREVPENTVVGGVPSPEASVDRDKASGSLKDTLKLRLEYVLDGKNSKKAVPRYVPEAAHTFLTDAKTGELLDLTELEEKLEKGYATTAGGYNGAAPAAMSEDAAADRGEAELSRAELEGVAELKGILSKDDLDKSLRAENAYGLLGYALVSAAYESGKDSVTCTLRYARTEDGEHRERNITVDAKTGAVESIWSSAPSDREKAVTEEEAVKKAEAFLKTWRPGWDVVLYQKDSEVSPLRAASQADWRFTFAQKANDLPFGGNYVQVGIDGADGSISRLFYSWDEDMTFEDPKGVIGPDAALAAWAGTYETTLAYRNVPQKLNKADPTQAGLMDRGLEYYYALQLTYGLEREGSYEGVDARTGEPVRRDQGTTREPLAYTDVGGSSARADIEKLARYGVGYAGGIFRPGKTLTQWELVCLVYSIQGRALEPDGAEGDERENAYYSAYRLGLLRSSERNDNAALTRSALVKMLLDAAGYGPAARLGGDIFTCGYSDKASIPAEELGCAAVAQALGMASGAWAGNRSATRGEAASMLCRLLERTE